MTCILFSLFILSCYKVEVERNNLPQDYSVAQIIGTWKITDIKSDKAYDWDGNGVAETNIYGTWTDCQKDNLYQFNQNYSAIYKLSCSETKTGTWRLDNKMLIWNADGMTGVYEKIIYLITDTMHTQSTAIINGEVYTITKVWKFQ